MTKRPILGNDTFGKTPTWWKVWGGICLMATVGLCALGTWAVVTFINWLATK